MSLEAFLLDHKAALKEIGRLKKENERLWDIIQQIELLVNGKYSAVLAIQSIVHRARNPVET